MLTVLSIFDDERLISLIRMINVDKDWRHPLRSRRQSSKVSTFIINRLRVEDRELPCGTYQDENVRKFSEDC